MVASNRIIRFLGICAVNCKLSSATTNFQAGRYCRYRQRSAILAASSACAIPRRIRLALSPVYPGRHHFALADLSGLVIYAGLGEMDEAFRWLQRA